MKTLIRRLAAGMRDDHRPNRRARLAALLAGIVLAGFGAVAMVDIGGELAGPLFAAPRQISVADLYLLHDTVEVEVTGSVDPARVLMQKATSRGGMELKDYYHAIVDADGRGFWAYTPQDAAAFARTHGSGRVALRGVWEAMPRAVREQEALSHKRLVESLSIGMTDTETLARRLTEPPRHMATASLRDDRRLNLRPQNWKLEKAVSLAGVTLLFFGGGIALAWRGGRRREPRPRSGDTC